MSRMCRPPGGCFRTVSTHFSVSANKRTKSTDDGTVDKQDPITDASHKCTVKHQTPP